MRQHALDSGACSAHGDREWISCAAQSLRARVSINFLGKAYVRITAEVLATSNPGACLCKSREQCLVKTVLELFAALTEILDSVLQALDLLFQPSCQQH